MAVSNKFGLGYITVSPQYKNRCFLIDEIPFQNHIIDAIKHNKDILPEYLEPIDDLEIAWSEVYDYEGDARFMKTLLEKEKVNLPILLCPDDFDFTCIVIVAKTEKTDGFVSWKKIGLVDHANEDFEEEKKHGLMYRESYTKEDWEKYGDSITDPEDWFDFADWPEELYRRRINYTYPYYEDDNNIIWFYESNWCFDRLNYEAVVKECYAIK